MGDVQFNIRLAEGETLLWQGKPQKRVSVGQWWTLYLGALIFGGAVIWSFTDLAPDDEMLSGLHGFLSDTFCRAVAGLLALGAAIGPSLLARQTNGSTYFITSQRVHICHANGTRIDAPYAEMVRPRVTELGEGLANLHFLLEDSRASEASYTKCLVYALPADIAEEAHRLAREAKED